MPTKDRSGYLYFTESAAEKHQHKYLHENSDVLCAELDKKIDTTPVQSIGQSAAFKLLILIVSTGINNKSDTEPSMLWQPF